MVQKDTHYSQFPSFIELDTVDSTNNYARGLISDASLTERQTRQLHATVVFTHIQTGGKGQRGRHWEAQPHKNLHFSQILNPGQLDLRRQFLFSAAIALTVRDFLTRESGKEVLIKWPNDIYFQDKKAGGILIENIITGNTWRWAIVGIGLNINQTEFPPGLINPVSLKQITGRSFSCKELAYELGLRIRENLELETHNDFAGVLEHYNKFLYKAGESREFRAGSRLFKARIIGVSPDGTLNLEHGKKESFRFGELEWIF